MEMGSLLLFFILVCLTMVSSQTEAGLKVGFYSKICPNAEQIVSSVVREASLSDQRMPAKLLRLHLHDCFVEGCDASILIRGPEDAEFKANGHQGVQGNDVIEKSKSQLEVTCPGVVSCADIIALAARDAVALSNGPVYLVPTGRRDGRVSNITLADGMPEVTNSIQELKDMFSRKGLSNKDLVLLSAAHTIGTTACFFMTHRLYEFRGGSDPTIDSAFLPELTATCPKDGDVNVRLPMDHGSELAFDIRILSNIRNGFAVLETDAKLYTDPETKRIIDSYFGFLTEFQSSFASDFAESIVKMGKIDVKIGSKGEIRRVCNTFN